MDALYKTVEHLPSGSYGAAVKSKRVVVLKRIYMNEVFARENPSAIASAVMEAHSIVHICHENIVRIFNVFKDMTDCAINVEMEFCSGENLQTYLTQAIDNGNFIFPEDQIQSWLAQLCVAIDYLHQNFNIVHRNIKPSNIFVSDDLFHVKLADGGIPKLIDQIQIEPLLTNPAAVLSTLSHMPPEVIRASLYHEKLVISPKFDSWSLGVVIYQLLTFILPFEVVDGPKDEVNEKYVQKLHQSILESKHVWLPSAYSDQLVTIVRRLLTVEEEDRPAVSELVKYHYLEPAIREVTKNFVHHNKETKIIYSNASQSESFSQSQYDNNVAKPKAISLTEVITSGNIELARQWIRLYKTNESLVNELDSEDFSPLMKASSLGHVKMVNWLLRHGARVNLENSIGWTALMMAASSNQIQVVRQLIANNADLNRQDSKGWSSLMIAARNNNVDTVAVLIGQGASTKLKNLEGKVALQLTKNDQIRSMIENFSRGDD